MVILPTIHNKQATQNTLPFWANHLLKPGLSIISFLGVQGTHQASNRKTPYNPNIGKNKMQITISLPTAKQKANHPKKENILPISKHDSQRLIQINSQVKYNPGSSVPVGCNKGIQICNGKHFKLTHKH